MSVELFVVYRGRKMVDILNDKTVRWAEFSDSEPTVHDLPWHGEVSLTPSQEESGKHFLSCANLGISNLPIRIDPKLGVGYAEIPGTQLEAVLIQNQGPEPKST
jgi:hypothetical protein